MGRNADWDPSVVPGLAMRFPVIGSPELIVTRGTMPLTSSILLKKLPLGYPETAMLLITSALPSIGMRGDRSLLATTTDCMLLPWPVLALIATSTKAAITRRASKMPRRVKGLREVKPERLERAKAGTS